MNYSLNIRPFKREDCQAILTIYAYYVRNTVISFEEAIPGLDEFTHRLVAIAETHPFLVGTIQNEPIGYAYATGWKSRSAYRQTVESSIYLHPTQRAKGFGSNLYSTLLTQLSQSGVHTVLAGIALPNPESVAFHEKMGFVPTGVLREVGLKFGKRVDVGYWQRTFN